MLGLIVMFACFIFVALFALMNQDVDPAILKVSFYSFGAYKTMVPPWLLIALSLFGGAVIQFLVGHGREVGLRHRLKERESELQETKDQLRKVEDALLEVLPKTIGGQPAEGFEDESPPEGVT